METKPPPVYPPAPLLYAAYKADAISMAVLPPIHSETTPEPHQISPRLSVFREKSSARQMAGRRLGAEAAARAKMNKCKIVNMAAASVLALLLLTAAAVYVARYHADQLRAIFGSRDTFLTFCVVTHLSTICLLAWYAASAPTQASRRSYARATVASSLHLAANLYLAKRSRA